MDVSEFDYDLPEERIAQQPLPQRDASKLLVLDRKSRTISHQTFRDLPDLLDPNDLLILNDTRVIPARIFGKKKKTGGRVELLLLQDQGGGVWDCLAKGRGRLRAGMEVQFEEDMLGVVEALGESENVRVRFSSPKPFGDWLARRGHMPLPPYIRREDRPEDRERYQTVYANTEGAVAAPTAGLHFTQGILKRLEARGIQRACLTLHVGPGTFRPIRADRVEDHEMDAENTYISPETASLVNDAQETGKRIVAVGTTVVRTLEGRAVPGPGGKFTVLPGWAPVSLYITPGYPFRLVEALVTNFHLPRSTLLLLVGALAGRELILQAYQEALKEGYRFYSYGDAMLIV
jgi:S-adenosylmethionine:tRNA ribosyltransferase-isomerase